MTPDTRPVISEMVEWVKARRVHVLIPNRASDEAIRRAKEQNAIADAIIAALETPSVPADTRKALDAFNAIRWEEYREMSDGSYGAGGAAGKDVDLFGIDRLVPGSTIRAVRAALESVSPPGTTEKVLHEGWAHIEPAASVHLNAHTTVACLRDDEAVAKARMSIAQFPNRRERIAFVRVVELPASPVTEEKENG